MSLVKSLFLLSLMTLSLSQSIKSPWNFALADTDGNINDDCNSVSDWDDGTLTGCFPENTGLRRANVDADGFVY